MSMPEEPRDRRAVLKDALRAIEELQSRLDAAERARREPIAVVGMACRFPGGASTPEDYWRLLRDGGDAIREVPPERWDVERYYDPDPAVPGKTSTRWGGFLDQVDRFDARFFGVAPREAVAMDPQHRLFLEVA
jgi:acyl transferase domain-containing protein